jgi:hypothetical protein
MINRRTFLCSCGALLASRLSAQSQPPLKGFICSTLQVTPQDELRSLLQFQTQGPFIPQQLFNVADAWTNEDSLEKGKIKIGVAFLDGSKRQRESVQKFVQPWTQKRGAEIVEWAWDDMSKPHIRVTFAGTENKSHIGRQASNVTDRKVPTMYLADVRLAADEERVRQVILHEFGHALGLRHEIQHPSSGIKWIRKNVYADYYAASKWSKEDVNKNVLDIYTKDYLCKGAKDYDPKSIMMYPILNDWTESHKPLTPSSTLSEADLKCVASAYWTQELLRDAPAINFIQVP